MCTCPARLGRQVAVFELKAHRPVGPEGERVVRILPQPNVDALTEETVNEIVTVRPGHGLRKLNAAGP